MSGEPMPDWMVEDLDGCAHVQDPANVADLDDDGIDDVVLTAGAEGEEAKAKRRAEYEELFPEMSMMLGLPEWIRSMGVEVVEVDGWQDRGHGDPDPAVFVWHHTADGPNGIIPSLNICIYGAPYTAPGPLCNIVQSREPGEGNDKAYIIAAGTSYNAGTGGWNGVSGNPRTCGLEIEHTGTEELPAHRVVTAQKIAAGVLLGIGADAAHACHHWEWSYPPGSKIDVCCGSGPGGKCDGDEWRTATAQLIQGGGTPPAPKPKKSEEEEVVYVSPEGDPNNLWITNQVHRRWVTADEWRHVRDLARLFGEPDPPIWPLAQAVLDSIPIAK